MLAQVAAAAGPRVEVQHIEITQGIQDHRNSVGLIAGKRTFVRIFVDYAAPATASGVRGTLELRRQAGAARSVDSIGGLTAVLDPAQNGKLDVKRRVADRSLVFELPADWTVPGDLSLSLSSVKASDGAILDCGKCDLKENLKFGQASPVRIELLGMRYVRNAKTHVPRDIDYRSIVSWIQRAYPASEFEFHTRVVDWNAPSVFDTGTEACGEANAAITAIRKLDVANGKNALFHYYGVVYDGSSLANFMRGCASIPADPDPSAVGSGPAGTATSVLFPWDKGPSYAGWYAGHELGHTFGRHHPNSGCGDWDRTGDPQWPAQMPKNKLGTSDHPYVGFDRGDPSIQAPISVLAWDVGADLMTYCDSVWPSAHNYVEICNRTSAENKTFCPLSAQTSGAGPGAVAALSVSGPGGPITMVGRMAPPIVRTAETGTPAPAAAPSSADLPANVSGPVLSVTGRINLDRETGAISSVNRFQQSVETTKPAAGGSETPLIKSFDSQGRLLAQRPATVLLDTDTSPDSPRTGVVSGEVPYAGDIARLELVFKDKTLAVRSSSPERPAITPPTLEPTALINLLRNNFNTIQGGPFNVGPQTTAPAAPNGGDKGPLVYQWQAQGPPDLKYTVQISTNGGKEWNTVAVETQQHSIAIDPSWIQGATTLDVRVRASDGIHETVATSKQLDLGAKIPLQ
ncbi:MULTISPECIES: hypothetical protein [unclassified Bradyrhizobium]|uniref:hypothetical protein n=1 Tax=unclassified Bradyrhizobium TaxID=2631580 RepID=UPI001FFB9DFB|nr:MULTISPECIES: hypothetical protein [unclassified Bradyrhizobium]MCK1523384.1 hypothetical protein [Bradyrhizobium sp. 17]MCK1685368.1 hypothetical protein [Bradyrhizobium sp. 145]